MGVTMTPDYLLALASYLWPDADDPQERRMLRFDAVLEMRAASRAAGDEVPHARLELGEALASHRHERLVGGTAGDAPVLDEPVDGRQHGAGRVGAAGDAVAERGGDLLPRCEAGVPVDFWHGDSVHDLRIHGVTSVGHGLPWPTRRMLRGMGPVWDEVALESLLFHWGDAYRISNPLPGRWIAQRRDNGETLRGETAEQLHNLILADYEKRRVPREAT